MSTTVKTGNALEEIVALLHNLPGIKIETKVKLRSIRSGSNRKREIDVLLTSSVAGYPIKIAIECKNYKDPIKSDKIDEFLGKLTDVGIPFVNGIFVTASGFRKGALDLAQEHGIRPLVLEGMNRERLGLEVNAAIQSVVFILATWKTMNRFADVDSSFEFPPQIVVIEFKTEHFGEGTHALLNCLWSLWQRDMIPSDLGEHHVGLRMPHQFKFSSKEPPVKNSVVIITYEVTAHVGSIPGTTSSAILRNAATSELEKFHVSAAFNDVGPSLKLTLRQFETEKQLDDFFKGASLHIATRFKVPRIVSTLSFWPPTKEAADKILRLKADGKQTTFLDIEGENLYKAWEPSLLEENVAHGESALPEIPSD